MAQCPFVSIKRTGFHESKGTKEDYRIVVNPLYSLVNVTGLMLVGMWPFTFRAAKNRISVFMGFCFYLNGNMSNAKVL